MKRKLLLADDSITIQKVVNLTFADEGIDVITVGDGDAAIAKISESVPDVILADVHMPGLSGYQVCEMVRSNEATKGLPVVLLVGSFEPFDENEAARVGANAFLTKPFQSIRQLVSQVSDLMQTSAPAPAAAPVTEVPQAMPSEYVADATPEHEAQPTIEYASEATSEYVAEPANEYAEPTSELAEPPVEFQRSSKPGVRDTTDIDSLYSQSVGGPSDSGAEAGRSQYVDAGMDDEMIETVHAGDEVDEQPAEDFYQQPTSEYQQQTDPYQIEAIGYQTPGSEYAEPASDYQAPVAEYHQPVDEYREPVSENYQQPVEEEFREPMSVGYQQPVEEEFREPVSADYQQPEAEFEQPVDQYHEPTNNYQEPVAEYHEPANDFSTVPTAEYQEPAAQYEQTAESSFQEEAPRAASPFDAPAEEVSPARSYAFDETNPLDAYSSTQNIPDAAQTGGFSLDDVNLLELPPMKGGQTMEFKTNEDGSKQVVSLSPELMDALVEKVVSKLSKKE